MEISLRRFKNCIRYNYFDYIYEKRISVAYFTWYYHGVKLFCANNRLTPYLSILILLPCVQSI